MKNSISNVGKIPSFGNISLKKGTILVIVFISLFALSLTREKEDLVLKAYQLRIQGKTSEAKELLSNTVKEDSANASPCFELARTLNYMNMMGSPEADLLLKTALENDPENVVYSYYNAKRCFLKAYIAMQTGGDDIKNLIGKTCNEFMRVLELKPDYPEAMMYLVEIYSILPENMGGDKQKAEEFARKLENTNTFYGAKARLTLMSEETNSAEYWKNFISKNGESCNALKELGVAALFSDDVITAKESFEKAIALDKSQNIRLLDLARYHTMKVMQNRETAGTELPKSKQYVEKYLSSVPTPIPPLKAYALGMLVNIERFSGNNAEAEKLMEKAKALDPYFSRAFGIPSPSLFESPCQMDHHFVSFFTPF